LKIKQLVEKYLEIQDAQDLAIIQAKQLTKRKNQISVQILKLINQELVVKAQDKHWLVKKMENRPSWRITSKEKLLIKEVEVKNNGQ